MITQTIQSQAPQDFASDRPMQMEPLIFSDEFIFADLLPLEDEQNYDEFEQAHFGNTRREQIIEISPLNLDKIATETDDESITWS